jgi:hypothetical protein
LKQATKYNTTQQLLEKYGNAPKKEDRGGKQQVSPPRKVNGGRIQLPIPPTANIQRAQHPSPNPNSPPLGPPQPLSINQSPPLRSPPLDPRPGEEFAPNAFDGPQFAPSSEVAAEPHWYDRILDALLGEDESQAKNRLALICKQCRIVNGLAPPGIKTPEQLGKWRCSGCSAWNGEEYEAVKLIEETSRSEPVLTPELTSEDDKTTALDVPSKKSLKARKRSSSAEHEEED